MDFLLQLHAGSSFTVDIAAVLEFHEVIILVHLVSFENTSIFSL